MSSFRWLARGTGWGLLALWLGALGCRDASRPASAPLRAVEAMNRGVSLMGQYRYDDAVTAFDEALRAAPGLTEARINLAIARFNRNRKEDLEAARQQLATVLREEPGNPRALYFNAILLQHIGRAEEAVPALEQVAQARPEDGAVWYLLGLCRQRLGQTATVEFQQAVRYRPYLYSAHYQLYQAALRAGDEMTATMHLDRFKQLRESPLGESIELPQYHQMGELALALPLPAQNRPPIARSAYHPGPRREVATRVQSGRHGSAASSELPDRLAGAALADLNGDGAPEALVPPTPDRPGATVLHFSASSKASHTLAIPELADLDPPVVLAVGDYDNDGVPDVFAAGRNAGHLFHGATNGHFSDVTGVSGIGPLAGVPRGALWLDADHDGDLDLFVCAVGAPIHLFNNNGDGGFTDIAARAGLADAGRAVAGILPGDFDGDRDLDLVVLREDGPAALYLNELLGQYRPGDLGEFDIRGELGGAAQDLNGDGLPDLLVLGGAPPELRLFLGDGRGRFLASAPFAGNARTLASWGKLRGFRVTDLDLDGDLDIACFTTEGHALLNDGTGHFVVQARVWTTASSREIVGAEIADLDGDLVADLLLWERGAEGGFFMIPGTLTPPSTALAIRPTGIRGRDGRTRSPASGFGVNLTARMGLREARRFHSGQAGGPHQSLLPVVLGLGGASKADYVSLAWPDGVAQVETALAAGQEHVVAELQRKISSCPVLFAWNGTRFEFITDFAGVGGLGYFAAPGESAPSQVLEHVKIEPGQLQARDGRYELRVTEPMEEAAYLDRLELLAIDHPGVWAVFPDERLAISGPPPTHELLVVAEPIFPVRATSPTGEDCTEALRRVDRVYAYEPPLDRRYIGFCRPHTLELDFGDRLAKLPAGRRAFLFINGFIEYPYSQTVYAASQSQVGWEPIRVDRQAADGAWHPMVPDGGVPGGMARMMTIELSGLLPATTRKLRLTTNLEVSYDQIFIAAHAGVEEIGQRSVPLLTAMLRRVGFAREYSPDGRRPLIYDYEWSDTTAPFHVLKGAYTRYGSVAELLAEFDDRYVIMGPGDEVALTFDASALPPVPEGYARSFILISHAYCKDMDLYTATPQTLAPLPFHGMSRYPYPPAESYPATETHREFLRAWNTRIVE